MAKKPTTKLKKKSPPTKSEVGYKKPPKHAQIKKGQVLNPKGINISPEKRALKELTVASLAEAIKKTMTCTVQEIEALLNDPTTTVGHRVILRAALDASEDGNFSKFDHILERAIGKTSIKVDMTSAGMPLGQKIEDKQKVKNILKEIEDEI